MMIPNSPGGGYDLTGRAAVKALEDNDLTGRFEITNVLGASGTVAMQRLANSEGADDLVMTMGLGVVGAVYTNKSDAVVSDMTPIARLVEEQEGILVPADSPFKTVDDLVRGLEGRPRLGHHRRRLVARRARLPLPDAAGAGGRHRARATSTTSPTTAAARSPRPCSARRSTSACPASASSRARSTTGRCACSPSPARSASTPSTRPTLTEEGVDLVFTNWRGVLAPPGISDEQRDYLVDIFTEMHDTAEWRDALARNGWTDNFATGEEFEDFLVEQDNRVADTLKELGLA